MGIGVNKGGGERLYGRGGVWELHFQLRSPSGTALKQQDSFGCTPRRSSAWRAGARSPDANLGGDGIFVPRIWTPCCEAVYAFHRRPTGLHRNSPLIPKGEHDVAANSQYVSTRLD